MIKNLLPAGLLLLLVFACAHAPRQEERRVASATRGDCRMTCAMSANDCVTVCEGGGDCANRCDLRVGACLERCDHGPLESKADQCVAGCTLKANDCVAACGGSGECVNQCSWQERACSGRCSFP